ncbi:uncharacterized protein CLUP02_16462 [Colletotrichum lupini]|uniref:Uncharacterized protein n=1 Tax=Colletotrichum lupini TaxID=145971 RepID=A0A9Q8T8H0_9PEZI|nr:uncharacterized protein CLUP02_16462 [Colletotrichum lupini]UQC90930.1 hypothetical protein CLUP02_16462 [Colletotrichum lupini]
MAAGTLAQVLARLPFPIPPMLHLLSFSHLALFSVCLCMRICHFLPAFVYEKDTGKREKKITRKIDRDEEKERESSKGKSSKQHRRQTTTTATLSTEHTEPQIQ